MKSKLTQILKILISDVRQASVPTIILWLAGGAGGLYSAYKMVVDGITLPWQSCLHQTGSGTCLSLPELL